MELKRRYRYLFGITILTALPLASLALMFINGISVEQMFHTLGLEDNEQSLMLFVYCMIMFTMLLLLSLSCILLLYVEQRCLAHVNKQIEKDVANKDFYIKLKELLK